MQWQTDKDEAGTVIPQDTQQLDASVVRKAVEILREIEQKRAEQAAIAEATSHETARKRLPLDELAGSDQVAS